MTLARRLDELVQLQRVKASTENELWALAFRIADKAVHEKARAFRRMRVREREAAQSRDAATWQATGLLGSLEPALRSLEDVTDRQIVRMRVAEAPLSVIAAAVRLSPAAVRKRWERISRLLRARQENRTD